MQTRSLTCGDLVSLYLSRIEARPELNIFQEVYAAEAQAAAARVDARVREGRAGKLAGLVIALKDVLCYRGHAVTASSRILAGFESQITATAVQRLLDEDAIIIGRVSCDEFAMGSSNENASTGPVLNPWHPGRVPGGSSGGSAAAVAAGMCHAALGSDTGGSVRQPAAFCGVTGLKPTYGRISRWGLIAYGSSFDQIGPLTRSVEDAARMLEIMAGPDGLDQTAMPEAVPPYSALLDAPHPPVRIGYLREAVESPALDPALREQTQALLDRLREAGHTVVPVSFPLMDRVVPCYYILTTAEASSNLARYDGIRYGYRSASARTLEETYVRSRSEGFGEEVQKRILMGAFVLSSGYYDAYYTRAMKVRRLIRDATDRLLEEVDILLSPTTPGPAFALGEKTDDPIAMYLSDIFTVHANLAGVPAVAIPLGWHPEGLPLGIQLTGRRGGEAAMLHTAAHLEQLIGFQATPPQPR
ncbi:MAG: Asp-tRNA(Asn)/Glu-tRNA(Gln) amidotransferase subunit GatA [Bacteroidia bacterium]|nr:Asp-tRNA(Asn)/Glu-tRNA(Gln) amidotransferase subunit GatA [Bacteroidia bacterium]